MDVPSGLVRFLVDKHLDWLASEPDSDASIDTAFAAVQALGGLLGFVLDSAVGPAPDPTPAEEEKS